MRILLTGAAGFVGFHVASRLAAAGHEVFGVDSFELATSRRLKRLRAERLQQSSGVRILEGDLASLREAQQVFQASRPDWVIHLAARPGVRSAQHSFPDYIRCNIDAFTNMWFLSVENQSDIFMYASSSSIYGEQDPACLVFNENLTMPNPQNLYGATKLSNEQIVRSTHKEAATRSLGLRLFTLIGPWGRPDMLMWKVMDAASRGEPLYVFGDGSAVRDFTYITDATDVMVRLLTWLSSQPQGTTDVINVGDGNVVTVNEFLQLFERVSGTRLDVRHQQPNRAEMSITRADETKLVKTIGPTAWTSLEQAVRSTWKWYASDQEWENINLYAD